MALFLLPCPIADEALNTLSPQVLEAVKHCHVFFVENERSARRFLKKLWKEIVIDDQRWYRIEDDGALSAFRREASAGKNIGIISEAGCPGVADPGQQLIALAQDMTIRVIPLVGPSSILLALMASGMNGQRFTFHGYLPIDNSPRAKALRDMENDARKNNTTHIFIETPYRNNQMFQAIISNLQPSLRLCVAVELTSPTESVVTKNIGNWKKAPAPELHKKTAIFLLGM